MSRTTSGACPPDQHQPGRIESISSSVQKQHCHNPRCPTIRTQVRLGPGKPWNNWSDWMPA